MRKADLTTDDVLYWTKPHTKAVRPVRLLGLELTCSRRDRTGPTTWTRMLGPRAKPERSWGTYGGPTVHIGYAALTVTLEPPRSDLGENTALYADALHWLRDTEITYAQATAPGADLPEGIGVVIVLSRELEGPWDAVRAEKQAEKDANDAQWQRELEANRQAAERYEALQRAAQTVGVELPPWGARTSTGAVPLHVATLARLLELAGAQVDA